MKLGVPLLLGQRQDGVRLGLCLSEYHGRCLRGKLAHLHRESEGFAIGLGDYLGSRVRRKIPDSTARAFDEAKPVTRLSLYFSRSMVTESAAYIRPLSYASAIERPARIGLIPSFERRLASFGDMGLPAFAATESFTIQMLPDSILVGMPASLNSESTGPAGCPVLPAGTTISMGATSPALAARLTRFLSRSR